MPTKAMRMARNSNALTSPRSWLIWFAWLCLNSAWFSS